jgi:glycosyltransferase involved in cell wall biosynthesis
MIVAHPESCMSRRASGMQVLSVHNRYQIRGGEDEVCDAERRLLQQHGHVVDLYEEHNDCITNLSALQTAIATIWSTETYRTLKQQFTQTPYDLVHVHNFLPLISPSVYYAARDSKIPVVQTLHNYRMLCPNALFFRDGQVCEDCLGKTIPWTGVQHGCYRGSRAASAVVAAMLTTHNSLNTWLNTVSLYIALTEFARRKFIEGGIPPERIVVKPHFVDPDPEVGSGKGSYALYVGRLSVEKGLDVLLDAWKYLGEKVPLKIVGDGPLRDRVVEATQRFPHVEWLGRRPIEEVYTLMGDALMLVFPSKWYETFGRVAIEAFAKGTPVVAARIGAIAELVEPGRIGLHFRPSDAEDLATQVDWLMSHPTQLTQMRQEARAEFEAKYTAERNYHQLVEIYNLVRSFHTN